MLMKSVPAASNPLLGFTKLTPDRKSVESIYTAGFCLEANVKWKVRSGAYFFFSESAISENFYVVGSPWSIACMWWHAISNPKQIVGTALHSHYLRLSQNCEHCAGTLLYLSERICGALPKLEIQDS